VERPALDGLFSPVLLYVGCALGALGVVMALPRRGLSPRVLGAIVAGVGLGAIFLGLGLRAGKVAGGLPNINFYIFSVIALGASLRVISHPRPVYAALYFILTILSSCGLYVLLSAEFMAFALVIVYAGAILITYLFVIMLATEAPTAGESEALAEYDRYSREPLAATMVGFVLIASLTTMLGRGAAGLAVPGGARVEVVSVDIAPGREGENPSVFVRLRSPRAVSGLLALQVGGQTVDLDPSSLEMGMPVGLLAGESAIGGIWSSPLLRTNPKLEAVFAAGGGDSALLAQLPKRVEAALQVARDAHDPGQPFIHAYERVGGISTATRTVMLEKATKSGSWGAVREAPLPANLNLYNVEGVAFALLNDHPGSIEIAGVVLLMAMLGAVVLARKKVEMDEQAKLAAQQRHLDPAEEERSLAEVPTDRVPAGKVGLGA
jgi:NADH:ubiquinone oxidoreductase subunit 6 (subunit J)